MTMCQRPVGNSFASLSEDNLYCGGGQYGKSSEVEAPVAAARPEQEVDITLDELFNLLQEPKEQLPQGIAGLAGEAGNTEDSRMMECASNEAAAGADVGAAEEESLLAAPSYTEWAPNGNLPPAESLGYMYSNGADYGASIYSNGREVAFAEASFQPSDVIEISEDDDDDLQAGAVGEKRKFPVSFDSKPEKKPAENSKAWWYSSSDAQSTGSKKRDGSGPAVVDSDEEGSDQRDERGPSARKHYSERVHEDRNLRTILQRMIAVDEKAEASPDEGLLAVPLLKHQRIALAWMEKSENRVECSGGILADDQGLGKTVSTIALILKARAPVSKLAIPNVDTVVPEAEPVDLDEDEDAEKDGDEPESPKKEDEKKASIGRTRRAAGGTLVICPTSVLRQWAHEIKAKVTPAANLSILVYHGSNRTRQPDDLAKYDVVLTTYPIVSMEVPKQPLPEEKDERNHDDYGLGGFRGFPKKKSKAKKKAEEKSLAESGPLAKVSWYRVVLDEAQSIKNARTQVARACWGLRAKKRWCLSGTPIQNAIDDLYSYFRFLRFDPLDTYKAFRAEVKDIITRNPVVGYKKLQLILQVVMLRRTKATLIDGQPIVNLPPRYVRLEQADFSEEEREFYNNLELESRKQFQAYAEEGTLQSNYVNILYMLLRLRQACDHPLLVKQTNQEGTEFDASENAFRLSPAERQELQDTLSAHTSVCTICADVPEAAVVSCCGHVFCRQCISEKLATSDDTECPFARCSVQLNTSLIYSLVALTNCSAGVITSNNHYGGRAGKKKKSSPNGDSKTWKSSSKIDAVMKILCNLPMKAAPEGDPPRPAREKAIVFSQWTSMLDLLEPQLRSAGVRYRRLDGTMSVMDRDLAVSEFNTNPEVTVMIMSLKAASLGLNMVAACHVLLLDVWWNPTTEDQAIDRAHRIGQTRAVHVSRFTVKNTIEDRILALQERKKQMVSSAFGENEGNNQKSRLTMDDLRFLFSG